jgi:hypothetical protein
MSADKLDDLITAAKELKMDVIALQKFGEMGKGKTTNEVDRKEKITPCTGEVDGRVKATSSARAFWSVKN